MECKIASPITQYSQTKIVTWTEYNVLIHKLTDMVKFKKWGTILAIAYGGIIPAISILSKLNSGKTPPNLSVLKATHYKGKEKQKNVELGYFEGFLKEPLLIVDDIVDSGETLNEIKKWFFQRKITDYKCAVLHYKPFSKIKPDYFVEKTEKWIQYPWEV